MPISCRAGPAGWHHGVCFRGDDWHCVCQSWRAAHMWLVISDESERERSPLPLSPILSNHLPIVAETCKHQQKKSDWFHLISSWGTHRRLHPPPHPHPPHHYLLPCTTLHGNMTYTYIFSGFLSATIVLLLNCLFIVIFWHQFMCL